MALMPQQAAAPSLEETPDGLSWPAFRRDLEILPRSRAGSPGGFLVRDPRSGAAVELGDKEFFLCGQLDGRTSPKEIRARFQKRFGRSLSGADFDAFLRLMQRQGLLVPNGAAAIWQPIGPSPGVIFYAPSWLNVDRFFGWLTERLRWCFSTPFAFFAVTLAALAGGVLIKHWRAYFRELDAALGGDLPVLIGLGTFLFMNFLQRTSAAVACKYAGGRIRWFGIRLQYYFFPVFQCDLSDASIVPTSRNRYRMIYSGFVAQTLLGALAFVGWFSTSSQTGLHTGLLIISAVLILFLPWNPLGPRNAYYMLSHWLEVPDLRSRSLNATWSWLFRTPLLEPLSRRQKWGFRAYGLAAFLFYGFVIGLLTYKIMRPAVAHLEVQGVVLTLVVCAFLFEFPLRKELMRFDPFYVWLARNNGRSRLAWTIRLGLILILLLLMFLPYPYEPGGSLRILPLRQVGIRVRVQGKLSEVLVKEGDWVKEGQVIARLDARETRKDLEVAEAELRRTEAQLALAEAGSKPEEIAKARESLATAEKELYYTTREAERLRKLRAEKVVSLNLYEQALERQDVSKGVMDTAKENLNLVMSGAREEALETQRAEVARLEALVRHYRGDLALTEIRAPVQGRIVKAPRLEERVGMEVILGDMIASVEDDRTLLAELEIPEKNSGDVKVGSRVKVKTWAYPNKRFIGQVDSVAPVVTDKKKEGKVEYLRTEREDALSRAATSDEGRVVRVVVRLQNPDGLLKSEMTGYGKVFTGYKPFGLVMTHGLVRFFRVEVWSWIP